MTPAPESHDAAQEPVPLTDERIDFIAETVIKGMPDGIQGFLRAWGWRQFARALLEDCAGHYREPGTITRLTAERDAARRDAERWRALYRRAINEANELTNYVEDRPYLLRCAERELAAIEAEARALSAQERGNV